LTWEEIVNGKIPEAGIQKLKAYEAELNQTVQLVSVLQNDFNAALEETQLDWKNSSRRRTLTRSFFALVEGTIASLKSRVLSQYRRGDCDLSPAEYAILAEESYGIKESGRIRITPNFIPLKANIKFAFSIFAAKIGDTSFDLDTRGSGWQDFLKAIDIRNSLMHPKSLDELEFDDAKLECVLNAANWFGAQFEELMDKVKEGIRVSVSAESLEFHITELKFAMAKSIAREILSVVDKETGVVLLSPDPGANWNPRFQGGCRAGSVPF
jgi:hypothetical protein